MQALCSRWHPLSFFKTFLLHLFILCVDGWCARGGSEANSSPLPSGGALGWNTGPHARCWQGPLLIGPTPFILFEFIVCSCYCLGSYLLSKVTETQHLPFILLLIVPFPENVNILCFSPFWDLLISFPNTFYFLCQEKNRKSEEIRICNFCA